MKIKHYAGYGCVNLEKLAIHKEGNEKVVTVRVYGNHEWGLERPFYDPSCIYNWIGKKYGEYKGFSYEVLEQGYRKGKDVRDEEFATYELRYKEA